MARAAQRLPGALRRSRPRFGLWIEYAMPRRGVCAKLGAVTRRRVAGQLLDAGQRRGAGVATGRAASHAPTPRRREDTRPSSLATTAPDCPGIPRRIYASSAQAHPYGLRVWVYAVLRREVMVSQPNRLGRLADLPQLSRGTSISAEPITVSG
jgi:hypothetical protein